MSSGFFLSTAAKSVTTASTLLRLVNVRNRYCCGSNKFRSAKIQIVELTLKLGQAVQRNVTICFFEPRQDRLGCCPHAPWLRRRERTSKRRYLSPFDVAPIYSPLLEK
jgi:hypothetical protein